MKEHIVFAGRFPKKYPTVCVGYLVDKGFKPVIYLKKSWLDSLWLML